MNYEESASNYLFSKYDKIAELIGYLEDEEEIRYYETEQYLIRKALRDRGEDL